MTGPVTASDIRRAYFGLADAAFRGPFLPPERRSHLNPWPVDASLVHVVVASDLLADTVLGALSGRRVPFDNRPSLDMAEMAERAGQYEYPRGLPMAVRARGRVLEALVSSADAAALAIHVPTVVSDGAKVVVDDMVPVAGLLAAQVFEHVPAHTRLLEKIRVR